MVSFREAAVEDPTAQSLLDEYFVSRARSFPVALGAYSTRFPSPAQFVPPRGVFLLVEQSAPAARNVGCGGIRMLDSDATQRLRYEVKHLWLQPEVRGHGYGRALLAELERRAREFGASELVLDTNASLEAAAGLYRSSGFAECPPYNDNPNATHWYAKALTG